MSYFLCESSFILTQCIVLNLVDWFGVFPNKFIIFCYSMIILLLLYQFYSFNLKWSIIFYLNSGDICFLSVFLLHSFLNYFFEKFLKLSNFISKLISGCLYCFLTLFEEVLNASVADCLAWSRIFWLYLLFKLSLIFLPIFLPIFLAEDKNP